MNNLFDKELKEWFLRNLANIITIFGLLAAIWLLVIALNSPEKLWLITLLAGAVGLSDFLDGKIARKLQTVSDFGSALDRLRDKIFVAPVLIILAWNREGANLPNTLATLTMALVILLVITEIILFIGWWIGLFGKITITANKWGKRKMFSEFLIIMFWLISIIIEKYFNFSFIRLSIYFIDSALVITVFLAIKSLESYYQDLEKKKSS